MTKEEIKAKIIEIRHHIHMHPETGMDTVETAVDDNKVMAFFCKSVNERIADFSGSYYNDLKSSFAHGLKSRITL